MQKKEGPISRRCALSLILHKHLVKEAMRSWPPLEMTSLAGCVAALSIIHACGAPTPETSRVKPVARPQPSADEQESVTPPETKPSATDRTEAKTTSSQKCQSRMGTNAPILIAGADLYQAALFMARVFRVNVMVLEGTNEPVHLALSTDDADEAFESLAREGNMQVARQFGLVIIGPEENLARLTDKRMLAAPVLRPTGSTRVDLKLYRVKWDALLGLLPESSVTGGALVGAFTVDARNVPFIDILELLFQMAGARFSPRGREMALEEDAVLPDTALPVSEASQVCDAKPKMRVVKLPGVPLEEMKLTGISRRPGNPPMALVTHTSADPCAPRHEMLRVNDFLGEAPKESCASTDSEGNTTGPHHFCNYRLTAIHDTAVELELVRDEEISTPYTLALDTCLDGNED
jgi:hypothetical protein